MSTDFLEIEGVSFSSRLFVGTGKFSSGECLQKTIESCGTEMVTVAMKRANPRSYKDSILDYLTNEKN